MREFGAGTASFPITTNNLDRVYYLYPPISITNPCCTTLVSDHTEYQLGYQLHWIPPVCLIFIRIHQHASCKYSTFSACSSRKNACSFSPLRMILGFVLGTRFVCFLFHLSSLVKNEIKSFYHPFLQCFVLVVMEACFFTPFADAK